MDELPKYWAFISYSHYDRRVARWCKESLEKQRVPRGKRSLVQSQGARLQPLFLDERAMSAAPALDSELRKFLDASRSLVVICSPFATLSGYVNDEIRYFQSIGRGHRIFCVAASGIPNATDAGKPQLECFPIALRSRLVDGEERSVPVAERPLAAVLGDEGERERKNAIRQLLGGLLDISDVELRRAEGLRKGFRVASSVAASALAVMLLVLFALPWRTYSEDYVRRKGMWEEVSLRSRRAAMHGGEHYTFIRYGALSKPKRVRFEDGFGHCPKEGMNDVLGQSFQNPCNTSRACEADFDYGPHGKVQQETLLDQYGKELETLIYDGTPIGQFKQGGFTCNQSHSGVGYVRFESIGQGKNKDLYNKLTFLSRESSPGSRQPRANNDGAYGLAFDYDDHSRVTRIASLGIDGNLQTNHRGFAMEILSYNSRGDVVGRTFRDSDGNPTITNDGYSGYSNKLDSYGNVVERTFLDLNGKPTSISGGYASTRSSIGSHGEELRTSYFDQNGNPTTSSAGIFAQANTYDSHGNEISIVALDASGQPTLDKDHISQRRYTYDSHGNPVRTDNFGVNGEKVFDADGDYSQITSYDEHGNDAEIRYVDANGNLTPGKSGIAIMRFKFDDHNQITDTALLDALGRPTIGPNGYSGRRFTYDEPGNETAEEKYGMDGKPTLDGDGVSRIEYHYNEQGLKSEQRSLALGGQPAVTNTMGEASVVRYEYDSAGRKIKESFFDGAGMPAVDNLKISSITYKYDSRRNITDLAFFGTDGSPTPQGNGAFAFHREYDSRGNIVWEDYRDANGNLMISKDGDAALRIANDRLGDTTSTTFLGLNLEPVLVTTQHVAGWSFTYDEKGNITSKESFGVDGHLMNPVDGIARYAYRYSPVGDRMEERYFDANLQPAATTGGVYGVKYLYDDHHRQTEETWLDGQGNPMDSPKQHYATIRSRYDSRGRRIEQSYFHPDGTPAVVNNNEYIERYSYDDRGNQSEMLMLDQNGQMLPQAHESRAVYVHDTFGRETQRRFYSSDGKPVRSPETGRSEVRTQYDTAGRKILEVSLDENEQPVDRLDTKWSKLTESYAPDGSATLVCTSASGRKITPCKDE
jgi:YD repeat-containing protein